MNVFEYASANERMFEQIMSDCGYERKTTFYSDLSIAEFLGNEKGVRDTYHQVVKEWSKDAVYFTEFVMCLNHKIWQHYYGKNDVLAKVYDELWKSADELVDVNFNDEQKAYYYQITD